MNMDFPFNSYSIYPRLFEDSAPNNAILPSGNCKEDKSLSNASTGCWLRTGKTYWSLDAAPYPSMESYLDAFYQQQVFTDYTYNLAVDGPSCCGKSRLIDQFNPLKVNAFYNVQSGNSYNIFPASAISYIYINQEFVKLENSISDRSIISNIAYLMAYYIMNCKANNINQEKTMHGLCEEVVEMHNLKNVFSYIKGLNCNVLIIMDSSYKHSKVRMHQRGLASNSFSDQAKSQSEEYHAAQIAAFAYIANILNFPCLDLNYVRDAYKVEDEDSLFQANANAFHKNNCLTNKNYNLDIPVTTTTNGTDFFKKLQEIGIDLSYR